MLTPKQERFTLNLFKGMSQRQAYIEAGYSSNSSPNTIDKHAHELAHNAKIVGRFNELQKETETPLVMDVTERKERLSEIGRANIIKKDSEIIADATSNIRAIDTLNKMDKIYTEVSPSSQGNLVINIIVSSEKAKELTENISRRLLKEDATK